MKTREDVIEELKPIFEEVLAVDPDEVIPSARFEADLGGESIDLLDFAFRCEKRFGIRLNLQKLIEGDDLKTDPSGRLTPDSVAALKRRLPFLDDPDFQSEPHPARIPKFITVDGLAGLVCEALAQKQT